MIQTDSASHPVDIHVGGMIRMRRKLLGVSQDQLATALGLSFQQVQKYERGSNRVSASKLYEIGVFLKVGTGYFFQGLPEADTLEPADGVEATQIFLSSQEGHQMAAIFARVPAGATRRRLVDLIRTVAGVS
ncbi:helix-turn-helix domain-containing protein [Caulobacter soli]|uniref:helix-turn-helix domain-containing protein n=1 Tax=Caulobacter soli TaxID=2708539 RepID=UPI0013E9E2F6|nr:helix-turn-helix domain-containing protein [Caulobacter soli]